MPVSLDRCVESRATIPRVVPYPPIERELDSLRTAVGLSRLAVIPDGTPYRRCNTSQAMPGDDDHRVGPRESLVQGAAVVPVDDPPIPTTAMRSIPTSLPDTAPVRTTASLTPKPTSAALTAGCEDGRRRVASACRRPTGGRPKRRSTHGEEARPSHVHAPRARRGAVREVHPRDRLPELQAEPAHHRLHVLAGHRRQAGHRELHALRPDGRRRPRQLAGDPR